MASILIVYGSTTGNTRDVAGAVEKVCAAAGHTVTVLDAADASPEGLCDGYGAVLFGCSTWGDTDLELQDDFASLFSSFDAINAGGKKAAVFGCGDSSYTHYCGAVDAIEHKLKQLGAELLAPGLKIDGDPGDAQDSIEAWAEGLTRIL